MSNPHPLVVGVRFTSGGRVYHFDGAKFPDLKPGDAVIVETSRGWQLGYIAEIVKNLVRPQEGTWKAIERLATPRDLMLKQSWQKKEADVVEACRLRVKEIALQGVKIVSSEYSFDGSRLYILYSTETEEKVDLKSLRQDMQKMFAPAQLELRQIGPRDVAKLMGGMGACGLETRCCTKFLLEFSSISIKMAKEQGISLTPSEITGMCGRLRCCLIYEYEFYASMRQQLPKKNKRVLTPLGEGKVVDVLPLQEIVVVELPEIGIRQFSRNDVTLKSGEENEPGIPKGNLSCGGSQRGCPIRKGEGRKKG